MAVKSFLIVIGQVVMLIRWGGHHKQSRFVRPRWDLGQIPGRYSNGGMECSFLIKNKQLHAQPRNPWDLLVLGVQRASCLPFVRIHHGQLALSLYNYT